MEERPEGGGELVVDVGEDGGWRKLVGEIEETGGWREVRNCKMDE